MNTALDHRALARPADCESRFVVPGMRCAGCMAKIERGMLAISGVDAARVNLSAKRLVVRHDESLEGDVIVQALSNLGFEAQVEGVGTQTDADADGKMLLRALAVAGFGMMNVMLLSVSIWSGADGATREMFHWLSAIIALPVVAYSGRVFFASALRALRHGRTNMDVPISIGVLLATGLSLYETTTGGEHAYFDGAVMLLFFLLAGRTLDARMRDRTRAGIGALLSRMGRSASVFGDDGTTARIAADHLEPGMLMLVAAGEALAADGIVATGRGAIDNSMLTGESCPQPVGPGDAVHAGAINVLNPLQIRVTASSADTAISRIARLMDEAGQSRGRYVRIADRASRLYAPAVHTLAALAFAGWLVAGAGWHQSLVIAIAVLIITCPCAMGLAVPTAQVVASGALIRRGLLVKDGSALERLAEVDVALLDKTGTLTLGEPRAQIDRLGVVERSVALALAQHSRHPLSRGLAATLTATSVRPAKVLDVEERAGSGVSGQWNRQLVALERSDSPGEALAVRLRLGDAAETISFCDSLRSDAREALAMLEKLGVEASILSGDRAGAVEGIGRQLGINWEASADPERKLQVLEQMKIEGLRPLMVGDGLNDGPALAAAHASIAPGTASDASQQAADAVFIGERLMPVALAVRVARSTMGVVRQNFAFAIGYNILAVPLAISGLVTPLIAAIAMSVSSLVVVANSLRLAGAAR